jgi:DNA-binding SARP family transcriptional activator
VIEFRVLGPLQVVEEGRAVPLGGTKQRGLLALLLLNRNHVVPRERLIDALWGDDPPASAANSIHVYVSKLRRLLDGEEPGGESLLATEPPGYVLRIPAGVLDAEEFEHLLADAKTALAADAFSDAEGILARALALWRGPALADLAHEPYAQAEISRLEGLRLEALETRFEVMLAVGRRAEAVTELEALVGLHPLDERLRAQLMRALYRSGRQAEALESYRAFRRLMSEELGLEPGPELRELEQAILRQEPSLHPPEAPEASPSPVAARQEAAPPAVEAAVEREVRKVVTALFCDLSGETGFGERLDPELRLRVLDPHLEEVGRVVAEHGGVVEKFGGDALLAVFGLPRAHEDDALRAARAAADIRHLLPALDEETGFEPGFRIGIDTGEVVAGGAPTLATGDPVTAAQRLARVAERGEILLGAETVRLLGSLVEAEPLEPLPLQGRAEPAQRFRFRGMAAPAEPERSLFVGRERELALLQDALRRSVEGRELHLFTLLGPAGIGKSRLAAEFVDSLEAPTQLARGRCLSYGQALTYWPLVEMLRELGEPVQSALERVVEGGATSPQELAWTVQRALEQVAEERPLVVVLEDLHWAEPALLDLLDGVTELSRGAPILLLCLARPELLDARPGWGGGRLNATSVLLEPLSSADCELLSALARPLEPEQRQRVVERAAGNPLFVEELTHFLAEGGDDRQLPPRIHALLQARLDLLAEPERLMLACAAVEGTVFHRGSLEVLLSEGLRPELSLQLAALTRKELVRPAPADVEGEEGFHFRHQLIRDAAYAAIPKGERGPLHERFAEWLEKRSGEREELAEIRAYHLEQAALYGRELNAGEPELEARAASALAVAGGRARRRTDLGAAADLWRRALALLDEEDARAPELTLDLALALPWLGQLAEAEQLLERAASQTADPSVAAAARLTGLLARLRGAPEGVPAAIRRECAEAIPLFEQASDHRRLALAWYALGQAELAELQVQAAAQAWANAVTQAQLAGDRAFEIFVRNESTERAAIERTPWADAVRKLERVAAEFPREPALDVTLKVCRAAAAYHAGRREQARPLAREALDGARRIGLTLYAAIHSVACGWLEMLGGDLVEGERLALSGIGELRELGERNWLGWALTWLAEIRIAQGRYTEALELAGEAVQRSPHDRKTLIGASCARACAHVRLGAIEHAQAAAAEAVALAETTDSLWARADAQYALAETLAAADELPAALAAAGEARRLYATLELGLLAQRAGALVEQIEGRMARPTYARPPSDRRERLTPQERN